MKRLVAMMALIALTAQGFAQINTDQFPKSKKIPAKDSEPSPGEQCILAVSSVTVGMGRIRGTVRKIRNDTQMAKFLAISLKAAARQLQDKIDQAPESERPAMERDLVALTEDLPQMMEKADQLKTLSKEARLQLFENLEKAKAFRKETIAQCAQHKDEVAAINVDDMMSIVKDIANDQKVELDEDQVTFFHNSFSKAQRAILNAQ